MTDTVPRLRIFAGPNGTGKSTLKGYLLNKLLGVYLNPDEIEKEVRDLDTWIWLILASRMTLEMW